MGINANIQTSLLLKNLVIIQSGNQTPDQVVLKIHHHILETQKSFTVMRNQFHFYHDYVICNSQVKFTVQKRVRLCLKPLPFAYLGILILETL